MDASMEAFLLKVDEDFTKLWTECTHDPYKKIDLDKGDGKI